MARNQSTDGEVIPDTTVDGVDAVVATPKAKKEPTRGVLPSGYVTPVGLAKEITARGLHSNKDGVVVTLAPQVVYSYIKNASKDHPFPMEQIADSLGKTRDALNLEAGLAWWAEKNTRTAAGKVASAAKKEAKAAKAAAAPVVAAGEVG